MLQKVLILVLVIGLASCSTLDQSNRNSESQKSNQNPDIEVSKDEHNKSPETEQFRVQPNHSEDYSHVEELEVIPTELNNNVDKWINYFQGRGRPHMERYLLRSTRYEPLMKKVLRDNKLPEDLFYIALIESGFSSSAFSHASAVGYWQFIRGTGKRYKLKINQLVDERRDPVLSTQAAAEYFKDLYAIFNSWYLAMASYNVGEGRVMKVVKKYKTNDFWQLSKNRRALPRETDEYIPKYIAAKLIAKNPDKYGFDGIDYMPPIEFDHIDINQPVNLRLMAEKMNFNYEDFKALNPKYKGEIAPIEDDGTLGLRIPPGSYELAMNAAKESYVENIEYIADKDEIQIYKVKKGDTLSTIARRFRTNVAYLRDMNDFPRKKKIKLGMKIYVPDRTPLTIKRPELSSKFHIVQPGDSLASIANKYKVPVSELAKINNIKSKSKIKVGIRIKLPSDAIFDQEIQQKNSSSRQANKTRKMASQKNKKSEYK